MASKSFAWQDLKPGTHRAIVINEFDFDNMSNLNLEVFKQISGGDPFTINQKNKE